MEASKEGRSLTDFKYACVGYSVYLDKRNQAPNLQEKQVELPFCVGIEVSYISSFFSLFSFLYEARLSCCGLQKTDKPFSIIWDCSC